MNQEEQVPEELVKAMATYAAMPKSEQQRLHGKRQQQRPKLSTKPMKVWNRGREVPPKIHSSDLNPVSAEIEEMFLHDLTRLDRKTRLFTRAYIQGEANPYSMPDHPRTVVDITNKQRVYKVDGKAVLYVDLTPKLSAEDKAAIREINEQNRKAKPNYNKRPFEVIREIIKEREI